MEAQQNLLGHVSNAVHQAQTQGHTFQAQIIERFNDMQQSIAILSDSLDTLSQAMEANHAQLQSNHAQVQNNHQATNDRFTQLENGLGTLRDILRNEAVPAILNRIQPVRDTVDAISAQVNNFDLHIVQPILGAVTHSEEIVMGRIGQLRAALANIGDPILQAVGASENRITAAVAAARNQVRNDVSDVREICHQVRGHTEGTVVPGQTQSPLRTALCDGIQAITSHVEGAAAPGQEALSMRQALLNKMKGLRDICKRVEHHVAGPEAGQEDAAPMITQISTSFKEIRDEMRAGL